MTAIRKRCDGEGQPAIEGPTEDVAIYPHCPVCGREFSAAGRAGWRYANAWQSVPSHYVTSRDHVPAVHPNP